MNDLLSRVEIISVEAGSNCNLKKEHKACPINYRKNINTEYGSLTVEDIIQTIVEAEEMGFKGYFAFHFYNEPMLYQDKIREIIEQKKTSKYLLWTNGTLLKEGENPFLELFNKVIITCYDDERLELYKRLEQEYLNITIQQWELDNRLDIYNQKNNNKFGCKRIFFELPIDYYGNVYLCCKDWDNSYVVGNIKKMGFAAVVQGSAYNNMIKSVGKRLLDDKNCPTICRYCDGPWIKLPKNW